MRIILDQVIPTPLASIEHSNESIWGSHVELEEGKKIVLNASSGKGKSTFTTTVTGIRDDYTGVISYDGTDIRTFSPNDWALIRQQKVAVVFQDLQLFPKLTVAENLLLKNSLTDAFTEKELKEMIEYLGIADKWGQQAGILSMGQQQRVAIIRALAQPFEWLIMDEPFSHLDVDNTKLCLDLIDKRTNEQGAGFVLTTLGDFHSFNYDQELKL